jgi:hypothetical protein
VLSGFAKIRVIADRQADDAAQECGDVCTAPRRMAKSARNR